MTNQRINLEKKVYDKDDYQKTIDTSFKELLPLIPEEEVDSISIEQFFQYYNNLFFEIPKKGNNSHNTLIQQSSEYVGDEKSNAELEALYKEVTELRQQLVTSQLELTELTETNVSLSQTINNGNNSI